MATDFDAPTLQWQQISDAPTLQWQQISDATIILDS